jgi:hypothetical protein
MGHHRTLRLLGVTTLLLICSLKYVAGQTGVKYKAGALHGFLSIRSEGGVHLGYGELSQIAVGDRVTAHLVYHFLDGSLDDETTVFTQGKTFQFVSDHHIQRGPFFPKPSDITVEANGQVTMRSVDKNGETKVETNTMDIPPDLSNGMVGTILQNIPADAPEFKMGMIVPSGKGRAIKLDVTPDAKQTFRTAGTTRKASVFRVKTEIGGAAGVIAPLVGKKPGDILVWVLEGEPPTLVRIVGPLGEGTATVSLEVAGTSFPKNPAAHK